MPQTLRTETTSETENAPRWRQAVSELGPRFRARCAEHDREGRFVAENYRELTEYGVFSAGVPTELGGGGATHAELCELLEGLARHCPSTSLALSMHTHLVAASVWKWRHQGASEALLRKVAETQAVLVSTGATDWVESNGSVERVEGGYRVNARKVFASGSPAATLLITSAPYDDPEAGPVVLHFPVPFSAPGVERGDDWDALGMRGTGSHTVTFENVFVPDEAIALRRPRHEWPGALNVVLTVALPLIMAVYVGVAEEAAARARDRARGDDPDTQSLMGAIENQLHLARLCLDDMIRTCANYDFAPSLENGDRALKNKTLSANAVIAAVDQAVELAGGGGFYRRFGLEQLLRDVRAAHYHPLPERRQVRFTGRVAFGLPPV